MLVMRGVVPMFLVLSFASFSGCVEEPTRSAAKTAPAAKAAPPSETAKPADAKAAAAEAAPKELSEEDKRLIAADPKTLSPEDVRKRAFALRRKVMLNPDSPQAAVFKDLEAAAAAGELGPPPDLSEVGAAPKEPPKKDYPTFHLPGSSAPEGVELPGRWKVG